MCAEETVVTYAAARSRAEEVDDVLTERGRWSGWAPSMLWSPAY
jgi:hypothetical protein